MTLPVRLVLEATLAGVVEHWPADADPLPARRYIAAGSPQGVPWDCEQLTVAVAAVAPQPVTATVAAGPAAGATVTRVGQVAQRAMQYVRSLGVAIELVRAHPVADGEEPVPEDLLHAAGLRQADDLAALSGAVVGMLASGKPFPTAGCALGNAAPGGVEGGYASTVVTYSVDLLRWLG